MIAWQKAIEITKEMYKITKTFPERERFNLISQLNRAAVSIASNIAEGWGRESKNSYLQFLKISRGSLYETETQLIIVKELNLIEHKNLEKIFDLVNEEIRILNGLIKSLKI